MDAILALTPTLGSTRPATQRGHPLPGATRGQRPRPAAIEGRYQRIDRALYVAAVMTGLRQGELIALRWRDVDWTAGRIRVRQNYVLGEFGTPKSRRSTRSVPMVDAVPPRHRDDPALRRLRAEPKRDCIRGGGIQQRQHPSNTLRCHWPGRQ